MFVLLFIDMEYFNKDISSNIILYDVMQFQVN